MKICKIKDQNGTLVYINIEGISSVVIPNRFTSPTNTMAQIVSGQTNIQVPIRTAEEFVKSNLEEYIVGDTTEIV